MTQVTRDRHSARRHIQTWKDKSGKVYHQRVRTWGVDGSTYTVDSASRAQGEISTVRARPELQGVRDRIASVQREANPMDMSFEELARMEAEQMKQSGAPDWERIQREEIAGYNEGGWNDVAREELLSWQGDPMTRATPASQEVAAKIEAATPRPVYTGRRTPAIRRTPQMSVSETETIKETERGGPPLTSKTTRVTYRGSQTERLKQQIGRKAELASSRALSQARSYAVPKVRQELGIPDKPKPPPKPVEEPDESEEMYYKRERHPALAKGKVPKARGPYRVPAHIRERIASEREKKEQEETSGKEVSEKEKEEKPVEA